MFSPGQQRRYREVLRKAWAVHCLRNDVVSTDLAAFYAWKRSELMACIGYPSSKFLNQVDDYDQVMLHFWSIVGDADQIGYWSSAIERRFRYLIRQRLRDLQNLEGRVISSEYPAHIYGQMFGETAAVPPLDDAPAGLLIKLFQALDKHVRRIKASKDLLAVRSDNATPGMGAGRLAKLNRQRRAA